MSDTRTSVSDGRSTGDLVGQLSGQVSRLVRAEMRLAQAEMTQKAKHGGIGAGLFGTGGVLALFGFGAAVTAGIAALALVLPVWASALIVAGGLFAAAGMAALVGKQQVSQASPKPERTVENLRRDVEAAKEGVRHEHSA